MWEQVATVRLRGWRFGKEGSGGYKVDATNLGLRNKGVDEAVWYFSLYQRIFKL